MMIHLPRREPAPATRMVTSPALAAPAPAPVAPAPAPPALAPILALMALGLLMLVSSAGAGAGVWFDLGKRQVDQIHCASDSTAFEAFPPDAFGVFPTGSWVWEDIAEVECDQIRWPEQVCWTRLPVRAFRIEFNDGGCGCGGFVAIPSTLRLSYDPAVLAARDLNESDLRLVYNDPSTRGWRPVEGALPNLDENAFIVQWSGEILGVREYVIVPTQFVPVVPRTWSRIKSLLAE